MQKKLANNYCLILALWQSKLLIARIQHVSGVIVWMCSLNREMCSGFRIFIIPTIFLKSEGDTVIASVRPLCYILPNHWTKFNHIWCVSYSHEWVRNVNFFLAPPPGEGSKGQISFNFNYKVNFKDFYSKLCVCSHKWKIQNISDVFFYSVARVMP